MKRALRMFGNRLGNCAYDKIFLKEVKTRPAGSTNNLMRAANYPAEVKSNPAPPMMHHVQQHQVQTIVQQEIVFDDSVFDTSMIISEEDLAMEATENIQPGNVTFPSTGIYPLPPRPRQ